MKLEIVKEKKKKNGDTVYTFEFDNEFKKAVKLHYNKKRFSEKLGKRFVLEALKESMKQSLLDDLTSQFDEAYKLNKV